MTETRATTPNARPLQLGTAVLAGMILLVALSRLLPHPPNFSPVQAMALFAGAWFAQRQLALLVPLLAMLVSDVLLGLIHGGIYFDYFVSAGFWLVYLAMAACAALGFALRGRVSAPRVLGYALGSSLLFFAITNFGAWLADIASAAPVYAPTLSGLAAAYIAGIPFLQNTLVGALFFSALLFGGFALLRRGLPALHAQTA